eukprot:15469405-Alexandrium_andersonii.AAC.1
MAAKPPARPRGTTSPTPSPSRPSGRDCGSQDFRVAQNPELERVRHKCTSEGASTKFDQGASG